MSGTLNQFINQLSKGMNPINIPQLKMLIATW
jgi:hypothetical protein